ncbi:MAG: efflux RND transporter permease subunit [Candidatus Omnitrophica bacterium]|nr:efflux RND transporter permease subunit [Candidatus Omnitrophota bacterium]
MGLSQFSVKRPVTIMMIYASVILMGVISWGKLPQELFPPITYPQLTIVTTYENAAPEEVETHITKIIEEAIGTVSRLRRISSISKEGTSIVIAEFLWGTNMDFAAMGLREKIDLIKERLPIDAQEPLVKKFNPFDLPIMTLSVTGSAHPAKLRDITERLIKDELEKIEGVASASVVGGIEREILVEIDQDRLQASGIPILDVTRAISEANINYPAGTVKEAFTEYLVRTLGEFQVVPEIEKISVGMDEGPNEGPPGPEKGNERRRLITLASIADVQDTFKEPTSISRFNGKDNISVLIQKQAQANSIEVVKKINKALREIRERLPKDVDVAVVYDQSLFIKDSINGVTSSALQGGVLAFLVLLFFLRDMISSLIVAFSIPLSVLASFFLMFFSGISINIMSLGGLALGIGMLVDNAIVVMENVFRHMEMGEDPKIASSIGAQEVAAAIGASTWTTIAIFLPLIFVIGIAGQIFKQLALTITYSLTASLVVALTIIPVLMVKSKAKYEAFTGSAKTENSGFFGAMNRFYSSILAVFIKWPWRCILIIFLIFLISMSLFIFVDKEFMPKIDQGQFIIKVDMPTGTILEATDKTVRKIEDILLVMPEVENLSINIGSTKGGVGEESIESLGAHQGQLMVNLKKKRKHSSSWVIQDLKGRLNKVELDNANIRYILQESMFKTAFLESKPIVIEVKGLDLALLKNLATDVERKLNTIPGLYGVETSLAPPAPETKINIIKDNAAFYQLSVNDIAQTAHIAIKGLTVSKFKEKGKEYDIKVRLKEVDRKNLAKLRQLIVHSPLGTNVPLSEVSYFTVGKGPSQINRIDQERVIMVSANIYKRALNKVMRDINGGISNMKIPEGYKAAFGGEGEQMQESFKSLTFALILSFILIYMIMASMFENLWQPLVIMFTVPMSMIGVAWSLLLTHTSLNIVAFLGIIILGGVVVNNGIVLIDFVNVSRKEGKRLEDSLMYGSQVRLRPILMTALTTILGLLPLALGIGEGSKLQSPMAITVMGGLTVATFLTLIVIPSIYLVSQRFLDKIGKKK